MMRFLIGNVSAITAWATSCPVSRSLFVWRFEIKPFEDGNNEFSDVFASSVFNFLNRTSSRGRVSRRNFLGCLLNIFRMELELAEQDFS
jgi:hypothetical protein